VIIAEEVSLFIIFSYHLIGGFLKWAHFYYFLSSSHRRFLGVGSSIRLPNKHYTTTICNIVLLFVYIIHNVDIIVMTFFVLFLEML
jgi:hypothetical protein